MCVDIGDAIEVKFSSNSKTQIGINLNSFNNYGKKDPLVLVLSATGLSAGDDVHLRYMQNAEFTLASFIPANEPPRRQLSIDGDRIGLDGSQSSSGSVIHFKRQPHISKEFFLCVNDNNTLQSVTSTLKTDFCNSVAAFVEECSIIEAPIITTKSGLVDLTVLNCKGQKIYFENDFRSTFVIQEEAEDKKEEKEEDTY